MLYKENVIINNVEFCKHYSDIFCIKKIGTDEVYSEAIDIIPCVYEYIETDVPLEKEEDTNE